MSKTNSLKILFTGDYLPDYNRTAIIRKGLSKLGHQVIELPFKRKSSAVINELRSLASSCDFIFMPSFTHQQVSYVRKAVPHKLLVFDPLISRYQTKIFDYKLVSKWGLSALRNFYRDKWSHASADIVLADTIAHKNYYHKTFSTPLDKIKVLYIGNDFDEFFPDQSPNKDDTYFHVGFYGGFIPLQGVLNIIDAAHFLRHDTRFKFTLIGNGFEYKLAQEKIAQLSLENIDLPGWVTTTQLREYINSFDLTLGIFGTTEKSDLVIPNKVYHYASCRKPILTKDSSAIREVFTQGQDIILIQNNPQNIASTIKELSLKPEQLAQIANNAYAKMHNEFNATEVAKSLLKSIECQLPSSIRLSTLE